jgi:phenylacetate-CoA ligase
MPQILRLTALKLHEVATGRRVLERLNLLNQSQWLKSTELYALQQQKLLHLVKYAYQYVPYYRRTFDQAGFHPDELEYDRFSWQKIPFLTKAIIHENFDDLLTIEPQRRRQLSQVTTSGSTGHPLVFMQDKDYRDTVTADIQRHLGWAGWELGQPNAFIWGSNFEVSSAQSLRTRLIEWVWNRFTTNAFVLSQASLAAFTAQVQQRRPKLLFGYASSLHRFAQFVKENPAYHDITFNGIFSSAEVLLPSVRQYLEDTFHCKVFNRYGSKELGGIACECEAHTGLHLSAENNYVEILFAGRPAQPGEMGDIIVTNLNNLGMPFIRYLTEDVGNWSEEKDCPCGRAAPMLQTIEGRLVDSFKTRDGRTAWAGFAGAGYSGLAHPSIKQFQIVQKSLDLIVVRLVKTGEVPQSTLNELEKTFKTAFGDNVEVQFEFPAEIPVLPSGKHRYAISELTT